MKFSVKDFLGKCDQIRRFLRIWSHLLKKSLMENFIFCAMKSDNYHFAKTSCCIVWYMSFTILLISLK